MAEDIRRTGPVGLKGLNRKSVSEMSEEEQWKLLQSLPKETYYTEPEVNVGLQAMDVGYGKSQYDEGIVSTSQFNDLNDIRYNNQPWYDTLANGVGKMLGTAGTTFLSSLVGLPYGAMEAASQGRWSALWDNDVTAKLAEADKWLEENMTNYKSQAQQNAEWYDPENLFSMNFVADDIIKNMGFTLGAAASMAVGSGGIGLLSRSLGFVNNLGKGAKAASNVAAALFSATGEGMIEARQGVEERNKLEFQKFDDAMLPEKEALDAEQRQIIEEYNATKGRSLVQAEDGRYVDPAYLLREQREADLQRRRNDFDQRYRAGRQQIIDSGLEMGNKILGANQVLLTIGDLIQFGKGMSKSFDKARHAFETSSKSANPLFVGAELAGENLKEGYKIVGSKNLGRFAAGTKGILTEGSEEMNQQWIQSSAGYSVNEEDINDYWRAKLDPESYRETTKGMYTLGTILDRGFQDSWGDPKQWEQFFVGGLTGMMGSYMPSKLFNQDKTKSRWNPARYGSWEGGAYNEIRDYNKEYNQFAENIDDVNKILASEDFYSRASSLVAHTFTESKKQNAVENNDKKAWKDEDDKQAIHDMQAFVRAGLVDDLRAIYADMGANMSDEDIESIVKSTTNKISPEEDKARMDRDSDAAILQVAEALKGLYENLELNREAYKKSVETGKPSESISTSIALLEEQIARKEDTIKNLERIKENYIGEQKYNGAYVDQYGNRTATNDEIREELKHNSEELNRKLNSYLDSIAYVNETTGGQLSKDQEDNLAYLHNLGKESLVRGEKIANNIRKQLPRKFLLKTNKSPEQLSQEYASSDLSFSKDDNTKEGYVEVDTSMLNDRAFRDFFVREVLWGGNINPEFGETADERAAREEEEKNLSKQEKAKRSKERLRSKLDKIQQSMQDAEEQRNTNLNLIENNFRENYRKNNNASQADTDNALYKLSDDINDMAALVNQAGEYEKVLQDYMKNPGLVEKAAEKEIKKSEEERRKQNVRDKFVGKDAKQINQDIANGELTVEDAEDFNNLDISDDEDLIDANKAFQEANAIRQKGAALKNHIREQLSDDASEMEVSANEMALQLVDNAVLNAEDAEGISPESLSVVWGEDDTDSMYSQVQGMIDKAFNMLQEDTNAQEDIPEEVSSIDDVEAPETGDDPVTKVKPEVVAPIVQKPSKANPDVVPKNPLTQGALNTIIEEVKKTYDNPGTNGIWRNTTRRNPYHSYSGTYHEDYAKLKFGEDSVEYKRSKAIWEYLKYNGAFDRVDDSSDSRMKKGDTIHFMVKYLPEVFGSRIEEVSDNNKPYALAIIMLNDNGEVLGDLPLAQLEPTYKAGNPNDQVQAIMSLQDTLFTAFLKNHAEKGGNEAIVDDILHLDNIDNLNLTFKGSNKPIMSSVKQVMRGVVPFNDNRETLNTVAGEGKLKLGVRVTSTGIALKRGDMGENKNVVLPDVGSEGQPYMLLATPSGEQMAIPFYMPAYDASTHKDTLLYKHLVNALYYLLKDYGNYNKNLDNYNKYVDVLKGLLQVEKRDGVERLISINQGDKTATLHLQSLTDPNKILDVKVPLEQEEADTAKALANAMSGIPINVSLQFLNDSIETGNSQAGLLKSNYNNVIGEIATVNLPANTTHTVNGWFTIEMLSEKGKQPTKKLNIKTVGKFTEVINGESIEIDADKLIAVNTQTGEIIQGNEDVNLYLARVKAAKPQYKGKEKIQVSLDGKTFVYNVKEDKFEKVATKKETSSQPESKAAEETSDITGVTSSTTGAASLTEPQTTSQPKTQNKTIEQINEEMKAKRVLGRQTKDAWDAIPNVLLLKMFNEGIPLQLSYGNTSVIVSASNLGMLTKALKDANMAAVSGNLTASVAAKPMEKDKATLSKEKESEAKKWIAKNLPSLSSEERVQFVDRLARMGNNASKYWGSYRSGVIQIKRNAPMGTVYHEAFHYVMDMILSPEERQEFINTAKKEYGIDLTNWEAEERLAEDFRRYALDENATGIIGRLKRWFRKLMDKINRYNRISDTTINQLFWKINNGELAQKALEVESFEKTQQDVLREIRNVQQEKYAWRNLDSETRSALNESGISEERYTQMSLEEKQQQIKCRG